MSHEEDKICPFCKTEIKEGATDCTGCHAFKGPKRLAYDKGTNMANGLIYLIWLIAGPGPIILAFFALLSGEPFSTVGVFLFWGSVIFFGGGWIIKKAFLEPAEQIIWIRGKAR
jgi:hypothetical protein